MKYGYLNYNDDISEHDIIAEFDHKEIRDSKIEIKPYDKNFKYKLENEFHSKLDGLPPSIFSFRSGFREECILTSFISSDSFYIQLSREENTRKKHFSDISSAARHAPLVRSQMDARINWIYAVPVRTYSSIEYQRVQVKEKRQKNQVYVQYLDNGKIESVEATDLRILPRYLTIIEPLCHKCALHGFGPRNIDDQAKISKFITLNFLDKPCVIYVHTIMRGVAIVDLSNENGSVIDQINKRQDLLQVSRNPSPAISMISMGEANHQGVITHFKPPNEFYVRLIRDKPTWQDIQSILQSIQPRLTMDMNIDSFINIDKIYLAKSGSNDKEIHRCKILPPNSTDSIESIQDSTHVPLSAYGSGLMVQYIDYGHCERKEIIENANILRTYAMLSADRLKLITKQMNAPTLLKETPPLAKLYSINWDNINLEIAPGREKDLNSKAKELINQKVTLMFHGDSELRDFQLNDVNKESWRDSLLTEGILQTKEYKPYKSPIKHIGIVTCISTDHHGCIYIERNQQNVEKITSVLLDLTQMPSVLDVTVGGVYGCFYDKVPVRVVVLSIQADSQIQVRAMDFGFCFSVVKTRLVALPTEIAQLESLSKGFSLDPKLGIAEDPQIMKSLNDMLFGKEVSITCDPEVVNDDSLSSVTSLVLNSEGEAIDVIQCLQKGFPTESITTKQLDANRMTRVQETSVSDLKDIPTMKLGSLPGDKEEDICELIVQLSAYRLLCTSLGSEGVICSPLWQSSQRGFNNIDYKVIDYFQEETAKLSAVQDQIAASTQNNEEELNSLIEKRDVIVSNVNKLLVDLELILSKNIQQISAQDLHRQFNDAIRQLNIIMNMPRKEDLCESNDDVEGNFEEYLTAEMESRGFKTQLINLQQISQQYHQQLCGTLNSVCELMNAFSLPQHLLPFHAVPMRFDDLNESWKNLQIALQNELRFFRENVSDIFHTKSCQSMWGKLQDKINALEKCTVDVQAEKHKIRSLTQSLDEPKRLCGIELPKLDSEIRSTSRSMLLRQADICDDEPENENAIRDAKSDILMLHAKLQRLTLKRSQILDTLCELKQLRPEIGKFYKDFPKQNIPIGVYLWKNNIVNTKKLKDDASTYMATFDDHPVFITKIHMKSSEKSRLCSWFASYKSCFTANQQHAVHQQALLELVAIYQTVDNESTWKIMYKMPNEDICFLHKPLQLLEASDSVHQTLSLIDIVEILHSIVVAAIDLTPLLLEIDVIPCWLHKSNNNGWIFKIAPPFPSDQQLTEAVSELDTSSLLRGTIEKIWKTLGLQQFCEQHELSQFWTFVCSCNFELDKTNKFFNLWKKEINVQ